MGSVITKYENWVRVHDQFKWDFADTSKKFTSEAVVFPAGTKHELLPNGVIAFLDADCGYTIEGHYYKGTYVVEEDVDFDTGMSDLYVAAMHNTSSGMCMRMSYENGGLWVPTSTANNVYGGVWWAILYRMLRELHTDIVMARLYPRVSVDGEPSWIV